MSKVKVLFFIVPPHSAQDGLASRMMLNDEARKIQKELRSTGHHDTLQLDVREAGRADDVIRALSETRPQVVHFSAFGRDEGLVLPGSGPATNEEALKTLFQLFRNHVRLVVLNGCFSPLQHQAQAIAEVVECVVGTQGSITDQAAVTFAVSFYRALAFGHSVQMAFDQAGATVSLDHPGERSSPQLIARRDVDPDQMLLIYPAGAPPPAQPAQPPPPALTGPAQPAQEQPYPLQNAFALLQQAVRSLTTRPGRVVSAGEAKQRMLEMWPGFDESAIGFSRFSRFLRQAHEAKVVEVRRTARGSYEMVLPTGARMLPPPVLPAPTLLGERPVVLGDVVVTHSEHPLEAGAAGGTPPPDAPAGDPREAVPMHGDEPATVDQLQRRPFAEVVGARMDEVRGTQLAPGGEGGAFMVHVHGPWGAGKTSVLNFLRRYLQDEERPADRRWVVVDFNAWRHQRIRPPWWSLLREVYAQAARQLGVRRSLWLRTQWLWWRFRADWVPAVAALLLIVVTVALTIGALTTVLADTGAPPPGRPGAGGDGTAKNIELALKILTALFAAGGAVLAASRSLVFGSSSAAQAYASLRSDPLSPIVRLFRKVVRATGRPVAVFVDDLDRCDGKYVVELLEGIQTLFRTEPVTYVVAADRKWICSSFEKGYGDFGGVIGEPGRPLGYLFLDKIFQVSASVPRPSPEVRAAYWTSLLGAAGSADPVKLDVTRREAEARAEVRIGQASTQEELEAKIAEAAADPDSDEMEAQAMRAAAARRITDPRVRRVTEHRLQRFAHLLEPNPRSMKRLVNAFGLHQATHFLEGRSVAPDALARWTIVELRWPLLADYLAARPHAAADLVAGRAPADGRLSEELKTLFGDPAVLAVVQADGEGDDARLDPSAIRTIVGAPGASPTAEAPGE